MIDIKNIFKKIFSDENLETAKRCLTDIASQALVTYAISRKEGNDVYDSVTKTVDQTRNDCYDKLIINNNIKLQQQEYDPTDRHERSGKRSAIIFYDK